MILKWGSHNFGQDKVGLWIHRRSIFDTFGRRMGMVHDWHILGAVEGDTQADITTALNTLETAMDSDYQDITLFLNDGTTPTQHSLTNAQTFGGTHVVAFKYLEGPWKMQTEYSNRRTFYAVVRGEIRTGTGQYAWRERMTIRGTGGAKFRYMPQLVGAPVAQTLQTLTPFFYLQEGVAIGREAYIAAPGPVYPSIEHLDMREVSYDTPQDIRVGAEEMYVTRWKYVMEATVDQGFSAFIIPTITG